MEHADKNTYLPTRGLPELCEAIAVFYDEQCGCSVSEPVNDNGTLYGIN